MCGLAGVARLAARDDAGPMEPLLQAMARAVAHRGPDETAYYHADEVGLAFTRLSLVDPEGGAQPLLSPDESVVLIANGEVYNHRELAAGLPAGTVRTGSDCEVLVHLYQRDGLRFLDQVRGMFALVLYDRRRHRLVFARDRFGIKPLYYHRDERRIVFASEVKAVMTDAGTPRRLDWERCLTDQMVNNAPSFDDSPAASWFTGIDMVPAATIVEFDLRTGATSQHRYWNLPSFTGSATDDTVQASDLIGAYRETLESAVQDCCMADVDLGLFLSGGIDSAVVAALASPRPRTFTALNGSTLLNGDAESAHHIARRLGVGNDQILFDTVQVPGADEWKRHLWLLETPLAGAETFYKQEMYRYVGRHYPQIKAMLLGAGADEFNGGYSVIMAGGGDWTDFQAHIDRIGAQQQSFRPELRAWWDHAAQPMIRAGVLRRPDAPPVSEPYDMMFRWMYRVVQTYNCWHEDRTAAGSGIEARVPFLDHRLIELMAAIPKRLRESLLWDKQILRAAVQGLLPTEVVNRAKGPFFYGDGVRHTYRTMARMLAQDNRALVEEALASTGGRDHLDGGNVHGTLDAVLRDPTATDIEALVRIVNLGLLDQMVESVPALPVDARPAPVAVALPVTDWSADEQLIADRVLAHSRFGPDDVLTLAEDVLLLCDPADSGAWYLAVDGTIEYVIDEDDNPQWLSFLRQLDGAGTVAETARLAGCPLPDVEVLIKQAVDTGILIAADEGERD